MPYAVRPGACTKWSKGNQRTLRLCAVLHLRELLRGNGGASKRKAGSVGALGRFPIVLSLIAVGHYDAANSCKLFQCLLQTNLGLVGFTQVSPKVDEVEDCF